MPKQELNLFKLAAGCVAPARTAATKVVRCQLFNSCSLSAFSNDIPDHILCDAVTPDDAVLADRAKHSATVNACCGCPRIDPVLYPRRNWHRTNMASFADEIDNRPMPLSALDSFAG